jgi:glycerol-3-phosphate O-acyltransferase
MRLLRGLGMNDRFGPFIGALARRYLDEIPYPADMAARIRELAARGTVIYVHRSRNVAEHLALASALYRFRLPIARFVGGLDVTGLQPLWRFPRSRRRKQGPADAALNEEWLLRTCVENGFSAELFLRRPLTLFTPSTSHPARYVETLIELQRRSERPIFLVPHFLALRSEPGNFEPNAADALFGSSTEPGTLRAVARVMLSRGLARFEVSEPIDLMDVIARYPTQSAAIVAKKVRWVILHHLARIERIAHGPPLKSPVRMRDEVMQDALLKTQMAALATTKNVPVADIEAEARELYDEIASKPDFDWARILDKILRFVWKIIYDGLEIEQEDLDRVRRAAREGPVVLVPAHRSHIDYLVVSQAFLWNGLLPPHTAAGLNLNFWPFGPIMRRMGAYFIRRSFKGDILYGQVFRAYVRKLFREGFTQEFFIEGTRSRTGKTLPPKLGMLSMVVDAYLESKQPDAIFVPASISYEKLIESGSYLKELGGEEKKKENAVALIKTAGVLTSKYGRVFITFAEPISMRQFLTAAGASKEALQNPENDEKKRVITRDLAFAIVRGINDAVVVTANSLAVLVLFGSRRRGLALSLLEETASMALHHVREASQGRARISRGLIDDPTGALRAALTILEKDGKVHRASAAGTDYLRIDDDAFLELDFYKNNIIHWFVPESILACAMRSLQARPGTHVERAAVAERTRAISRVLKLEFIFADGDFATLFNGTVERAVRYGILVSAGDTIALAETVIAKRFGPFAANLLANFIDSYGSVFRHVETSVEKPSTQKALVSRLLETARADWLSGAIVCREAVSKANIENAVALLFDLKVLDESDGRINLHKDGPRRLLELRQVTDAARIRS